ncbi:MAG: hypothetical protein GX978_03340 [Tissierellia bacterium]|jgi:hypothetical protein|nr:hypothetical protein [Tissierellia bacterium]
MARLIVYLVIILIQVFFRVLRPLAGRSTTFQGMNRRIQALKSDIKGPKRSRK